jgi:hypothetical protein
MDEIMLLFDLLSDARKKRTAFAVRFFVITAA